MDTERDQEQGRQVMPFVSALIVVRNEEKYVGKCLHSLLSQDYPKDRFEIIVVDGDSSDGTVAIVEHMAATAAQNGIPTPVRIVRNPKRILASGWNIGIKEARGEYVIRPDAHAFVETDFLSRNVATMLRTGDAACVGGRMETLSDTKVGNLIKEALSCPFGVGGSKFRCSSEPGYVDTVAFGLYRRDIFDKIGFFNEVLVRTQDNDLHRRMRAAGMKFYLDPAIRSSYYSRNTFEKLARQQFNNGKWTMINFLLRPGKMSIRHFIPLGFVLALIVLLGTGAFWHPVLWLALAGVLAHVFCGLFFAVRRTRRPSHFLVLPLVFLLMHLSYGFGSIAGVFVAPGVKKQLVAP